jgi:hypothetical protein
VKLSIQPQVVRAGALAGVAICLFAQRAHAESDAPSRALAVQLFDQAEALIAKQRVAEACPKYAESFRLDPQLGALIYLAECYEKNGQLASAWGSYREAEEMAEKRGDERAAHCHERAAALEPRLDRLLIDVPKAARVAGLEVLRDGVLVAETLWGNQAAVDPGKHHIVARASGYSPWETDIEVAGEAKSSNVAVPALAVDAAAAASSGQKVGPSPGASQRLAAIAVGSVGIVALGVGGFFGISAQSSYSDSKDLCSDTNICTQHGADLRSTAKSRALVSTIATGVGVAGLATAVVLWVTTPKAERPTAANARRSRLWAVGPSRDAWGLEVAGAF